MSVQLDTAIGYRCASQAWLDSFLNRQSVERTRSREGSTHVGGLSGFLEREQGPDFRYVWYSWRSASEDLESHFSPYLLGLRVNMSEVWGPGRRARSRRAWREREPVVTCNQGDRSLTRAIREPPVSRTKIDLPTRDAGAASAEMASKADGKEVMLSASRSSSACTGAGGTRARPEKSHEKGSRSHTTRKGRLHSLPVGLLIRRGLQEPFCFCGDLADKLSAKPRGRAGNGPDWLLHAVCVKISPGQSGI